MEDVICLGLDLAWSDRNPSGGAVIVAGDLIEARADLRDNPSILRWVESHLIPGCAAVLAVDAPLCVPNSRGTRQCERQLGDEWRKFQAGPYPSNRERFAQIGIRGVELERPL
jgi:predicted RNase H-like nuclease